MTQAGGRRGRPGEKDGGRPELGGVWRYLHLGSELAVTVALGAGVGFWLDRRWECAPWGLVTGGALGIAMGLYRFLKETL